MHGGKAVAGPANGNYKTGRYSKYLPKRLLDRYEEAENDHELLSSRAEVALMHARVSELVGRLYTGENGSLWQSLKDTYSELIAFRDSQDPEGMQKAMSKIGRLITAGAGDEYTWRELALALEMKQKLASHEWKRLVDLNQLITAERALAWASGLLDSVLQFVHDRETRANIATEFQRRMNQSPSRHEGPEVIEVE